MRCIAAGAGLRPCLSLLVLKVPRIGEETNNGVLAADALVPALQARDVSASSHLQSKTSADLRLPLPLAAVPPRPFLLLAVSLIEISLGLPAPPRAVGP